VEVEALLVDFLQVLEVQEVLDLLEHYYLVAVVVVPLDLELAIQLLAEIVF
jgi:hypothetical protein